jgi:hypothetical protein
MVDNCGKGKLFFLIGLYEWDEFGLFPLLGVGVNLKNGF